MAPLRICLISDHASPIASLGGVDAGGQNVYVAEVARGLAMLGARVDVLTRRDDPTLPRIVPFARGVRVIHVDAGPPEPVPKERLLSYMGAFAREAADIASAAGHDLVHANFFLSGLIAERLHRRLGLPYVVTFHALGRVRRREQGGLDGFPDERFAIEDRLATRASAVVAECPQDRDDLVTLYGADPARLTIIPCGVDTQAFQPGDRRLARARLGLPQDERLVLQLGRLVLRKGVDDVIRSMPILAARHGVDASLVVVGGATRRPDPQVDPDLARLMRQAQSSGVGHRVLFVGRRDRHELATWYQAADVFVSAPWYEPFGITPLEAMACGTPVVGTAVGGIGWTVKDGHTGLHVPPRDPAAIADALARILPDRALQRSMGRSGARRVAQLFTWDRVNRDLLALYHSVLVRERRRVPAPRPLRGPGLPPVLAPGLGGPLPLGSSISTRTADGPAA